MVDVKVVLAAVAAIALLVFIFTRKNTSDTSSVVYPPDTGKDNAKDKGHSWINNPVMGIEMVVNF